MKKKELNLILLIFIPIVLAAISHFIWGVHLSLISGIIYVVLFMFNLPNGSFMSTNSDYHTKRVNPNYKIEKPEISSLNKQNLITLLVLVSLIILSFFIYFQQI